MSAHGVVIGHWVIRIPNNVKQELENRGYSISYSNSNKVVKSFDNAPMAKKLLKFLSLHSSCRVVFNAYIKTPDYSLTTIADKLPDLLEAAKTSFIYSANCRCSTILDSPNIADDKFKLPKKKDITCNKCGAKNEIKTADYKPLYRSQTRDFSKEVSKVLFKATEYKLLEQIVSSECYYCGYVETPKDNKKVDLYCPKCNRLRRTDIVFSPIGVLKDFIKDQQGYWLEWFVWNKLKHFGAEQGIIISKKKAKFEFDIVLLKGDKIIAVSCKDTEPEDFVKKLPFIKNIISKFVLVTTAKSYNSDALNSAKKILGRKKFEVINSDGIEGIATKLNS